MTAPNYIAEDFLVRDDILEEFNTKIIAIADRIVTLGIAYRRPGLGMQQDDLEPIYRIIDEMIDASLTADELDHFVYHLETACLWVEAVRGLYVTGLVEEMANGRFVFSESGQFAVGEILENASQAMPDETQCSA
jgi:hypothetical protein